jgi:hypothetical protein
MLVILSSNIKDLGAMPKSSFTKLAHALQNAAVIGCKEGFFNALLAQKRVVARIPLGRLSAA